MGRRVTVAILALVASLALAGPARADLFQVTTTNDISDPGPCLQIQPGLWNCETLRSAVNQAAQLTGQDSISLPAGQYTLRLGVVELSSDVFIVGESARTTTVSTGVPDSHVFQVADGVTAGLANLTVSGGSNPSGYGGNLFVESTGTLSLAFVRVTGGTALRGGGILAQGTVSLVNSLVDGNTATEVGGGIYNDASDFDAQTVIVNSTVAGNVGGGIASDGTDTSITLSQATIARNTGGGVAFLDPAGASAYGSIIAANSGAQCSGQVFTGSANLYSTGECGTGLIADPQLAGALSNQGGQTDVLTIPVGSPAIDIVNPCSAGTDQRDAARSTPACDAGAYEQSAATGPPPTPTPPAVTPTPTPTATATPEPTPVPNRSVVVDEVSGKVRIQLPGSKKYVELDATQGIPVGSTVDTKNGKVELTSVPKPGKPPETAVFYDGIFKVTQQGGVTVLTLTEELAPCPKTKSANAAASKPKKRKLWGEGKGAFRTSGKYSAATVRGTRWYVEDSCAGTLTKVTQGVVTVDDFAAHRRLTLRKGKSYTARPRR